MDFKEFGIFLVFKAFEDLLRSLEKTEGKPARSGEQNRGFFKKPGATRPALGL
jgi:hypothetical protein